jgi:hypothetical protein
VPALRPAVKRTTGQETCPEERDRRRPERAALNQRHLLPVANRLLTNSQGPRTNDPFPTFFPPPSTRGAGLAGSSFLDFGGRPALRRLGFAGIMPGHHTGLHQKVGGWGSAGLSSEPRSGGLGTGGPCRVPTPAIQVVRHGGGFASQKWTCRRKQNLPLSLRMTNLLVCQPRDVGRGSPDPAAPRDPRSPGTLSAVLPAASTNAASSSAPISFSSSTRSGSRDPDFAAALTWGFAAVPVFDAPEGRAVLSHVDTTAVPGVVHGHKARLSAAASPSSRLVPVTPYCVQYVLVLGCYSCVRRS